MAYQFSKLNTEESAKNSFDFSNQVRELASLKMMARQNEMESRKLDQADRQAHFKRKLDQMKLEQSQASINSGVLSNALKYYAETEDPEGAQKIIQGGGLDTQLSFDDTNKTVELLTKTGDPDIPYTKWSGGVNEVINANDHMRELLSQNVNPQEALFDSMRRFDVTAEPAKDITKSEGTTVTTHIDNTGKKAFQKLGEEQAKTINEEHQEAINTRENLIQLSEIKNMMDEGMITGTGAGLIVGLNKALQRVGFNVAEDATANTEAYYAQMGNQVAQIIKQFGAGTGLSDADRKYAERIAGGDIAMTEQSLRKIVDMNETAMRNYLTGYNERAGQVMERADSEGLLYDLMVEVPEPTARAAQITTQEEYDKLGVGEYYMYNGKRYRKRENK